MQQQHRDDKLFVATFSTRTREGYLKDVLRYENISPKDKILAIAFGHQGKERLCNALGYMVPLQEFPSADELANPDGERYGLVVVYHVFENLGSEERTLFFQHLKELLLPAGGCLAVINTKGGQKYMGIRHFHHLCREHGFIAEHTTRWKQPPLNSWDHSTDAGKQLSPLLRNIPLLRDALPCSASVLISATR